MLRRLNAPRFPSLITIALSSLIILVLLTLLVIGLHRHQLSVAQHNADNLNPLPPLDNIDFNGEATLLHFDALPDKPTTNPGQREYKEFLRPGFEQAVSLAEEGFAREESSPLFTGDDVVMSDSPLVSGSWLKQIAELKRLSRFNEALKICRQKYPHLSAYQQAISIHRARIKTLSLTIDKSEELLSLYRLSVEASFLHDQAKGLPNLTPKQLKQVDRSGISNLDMPYQKIGYSELRLVKKTDIKLLLEMWGRPQYHAKPREFYAKIWRDLCSKP